MATYRNRATLISNGSYTYWNASDLDTDMSEHPDSPNPSDYTDFVIMFEIVSGGGGVSLPTSSSTNFDFLVPDGSGGWQNANRKVGTTDFDASEWEVTTVLDPSSSYSITQSGNSLILEIQSPTSASSQDVNLKRKIELPNFVVYGHIKTSANNVGYSFGAQPATNNYTRDLFYQTATTSTASNIATKRNGSESYPSPGSTTKTTGNWMAFSKSGDAMGLSVNGTMSTSESPKIDLQDFQNINRNNIQYNTTSYQYRAGTTGTYDSLTQEYYFTFSCATPAATGTYSVTLSYLELFPL